MVRKKVALVLHGYPAPLSSLNKLAEFLRNKGYMVIVPEYLKQDSFEFTKTAAWFKSQLRGKKPELILGLSLGGLVLPHVAVNYPKAKLVFVATGEKVKPSVFWLGKVIDLIAGPGGKMIIKTLIKLPKNAIEYGYLKAQKIANPRYINEDLTKRKQETVVAMRSLEADRHKEIVKFLKTCDNTQIIKKIHNKSLIISGRSDSLMPLARGRELRKLIKNSRLVITGGNHYGVMNKSAWRELGKFI